MIQLYVHIKDLKPTEPSKLPTPLKFNDPDEEVLLFHDMDCIKAFEESIMKEGIKYCLAVEDDGTIKDGNCRYWCAKKLGIDYLPVNLGFMFGLERDFYPKKLVI